MKKYVGTMKNENGELVVYSGEFASKRAFSTHFRERGFVIDETAVRVVEKSQRMNMDELVDFLGERVGYDAYDAVRIAFSFVDEIFRFGGFVTNDNQFFVFQIDEYDSFELHAMTEYEPIGVLHDHEIAKCTFNGRSMFAVIERGDNQIGIVDDERAAVDWICDTMEQRI